MSKRTKEQLAAAREKKRVEVKADNKELWISDHALWRYAERFHGYPSLEEMRKSCRQYINKLATVEQMERAGFRILGRTISTYVPQARRP